MKKLYLGIFAAIISAFSDNLLLYTIDLIEKYENYGFLFDKDIKDTLWGWILGMIFLPLLYLGYKGVKEISDEHSRKSLEKADWVVVFLISLGCVVHSAYYFLPLMHDFNIQILPMEIISIKIIEILFVICYIIFCTIITLLSFQKKNSLLYVNRFFNPLFWMIFAFGIFFITPKYGGYLAVSSFNCSIAFYFVGILANRKKNIS